MANPGTINVDDDRRGQARKDPGAGKQRLEPAEETEKRERDRKVFQIDKVVLGSFS